jgi:hypothetical protein
LKIHDSASFIASVFAILFREELNAEKSFKEDPLFPQPNEKLLLGFINGLETGTIAGL